MPLLTPQPHSFTYSARMHRFLLRARLAGIALDPLTTRSNFKLPSPLSYTYGLGVYRFIKNFKLHYFLIKKGVDTRSL